MKKKGFFILALLLVFGAGTLIAQEVTPKVEIDLPAQIELAAAIFMTGIGGLSVEALVSVIKRAVKADGLVVILISIVVSAGAVYFYLIPFGFVLWKFLLLTALVAAAANGIYLSPQKRSEK